jgi:hypothetical protein
MTSATRSPRQGGPNRRRTFWTQVPHKPNELAKYLAPLTRLLRDEVQQALQTPESNVDLLATELSA